MPEESDEVWYRRFFEVSYLLCVIVVFIAVAWWLFGMVTAGIAAQLSAALLLASGMTLSQNDIKLLQGDSEAGRMLNWHRPPYRPYGPSDVPAKWFRTGSVLGTGHVLKLHRNGWIGILLILIGVALQLIGMARDTGSS